MEGIDTTDPKALKDLLAELATIQSTFNAARDKFENRPTRGKYTAALKELNSAELPYITLSSEKFNNDSEASMTQQFKKSATKLNLDWEPSVVFFNGVKLLINFDADNAAEKFDNYIMSKAGIDMATLTKLTAELDSETR